MLPGKIPPDVLEKLVFTHLGERDPDLILGPGIGQDASLIRIGENVIVAATDPITGSIEDIGSLAVHVNANDIATFGVRPRWFLCSMMLPTGTSSEEVGRIMKQMDATARPLGISIVGGHTEVTEGIDRPIVAGFMLGLTTEGDYVTSSGASPGDAIIMTKSVALEGTAILCAEGYRKLVDILGKEVIESGLALRKQISVVKDGLVAYATGAVTAMHDPTEGGFSGGLHEICDASGVGFEIDSRAIQIHPATEAICSLLEISPLQLIASGTMLVIVQNESAQKTVQALEDVGIRAKAIGTIVADRSVRSIQVENNLEELARPSTDELWKALKAIKDL